MSLRIIFLDTPTERDVPHVVTDPELVSSYVLTGERRDGEYGYVASHVVRRATADEVERWRNKQ